MAKSLIMGGELLDTYIPVTLSTTGAGIEGAVKGVIELHQKTGFDRFLLSAPCKGWRSVGYPSRAEFEQIAEHILIFREAVRDYDLKLGWWSLITLKTGPAAYQRIVNSDGEPCVTSTCPLDLDFQERYSGDIALVGELAKPELIVFEDDFGLNCHNGPGCFCDLHLGMFAQRVGRHYTRDELRDLFQDSSASSRQLKQAWGEISRDSLAQFAGRVRQEVDLKTPWIPMGSMQAGCSDRDGDATEAVARGFAGDKHRPFVRLHGTSYYSDDTSTLPQTVFHALYGKQHMPDDVICYHESDTHPHTRFFMSAGKMRSLMASVYSYGFAGSTFQVGQALDEPNEEVGYHEMFMAERARFQEVMTVARRCDLSGCGLLSAPGHTNTWVAAFAHFGIPHTTRESAVNVLSGTLPDCFTDDQIAGLLRQGLILDGEAAERLCARGFSDDIGVTIAGTARVSDPNRDLSGREAIRDSFIQRQREGRQMAWYSTYAPYGNGNMHQLVPNDSATETITDLLNFEDNVLGPGMTRYVNALGGRVVVMGMSVSGNLSSSLFNYRRGRLLRQLVTWAGATDLVMVQEKAKVFCILNQPRDPSNGDLVGMVTLINLCSDTYPSVELHLPHAWRGTTAVSCLDTAGNWSDVPHKWLDDGVQIDLPMQLYHPLYLTFTRASQ